MNYPYLPQEPKFFDKLTITLLIALCICLFFGVKSCRAEVVDVEKLATAIYYAEGGANTRFPYGILTKYKTTTPKQACINTINHALKDWNGQGDFIEFLGSRYCPVNCDNDNGTNKYWVGNVKRLLRRAK